MIRSLALCLALLLPLPAQVFRPVQPSGKGPQRLAVDLQLLGGSRPDLGDLRLKDASGREIPYVLVPPRAAEPRWRAGRLLSLPPAKGSSGFELDLGGVVGTSRLRVEGLPAPFLKRFRLEGSGDRARWTELVGEGSLFDLPDESLRLLEAGFPYGEYRYLRLVWDDRSSARLGLPRSASVQAGEPGAGRPLEEDLAFEIRPSEPGSSRFHVRLPGPRLPIRALILDVAGQGPLLRGAEVLEGRLASGTLVPRRLGEGTLRRAEQNGVLAADLRIPMEAPEGAELDLKVDDGNNGPLALRGLKAELEPQPWIYFESGDGGPLTASYGNPKAAAPRYDLEALKDKLDPAQVPAARWEAPQAAPAEGRSVSLDPGPGASLERKGFRFQRAVPDTPAGMAALVLDAHVLAESPALTELRILDREDRQIPYILERRDEPLVGVLALPAREAKGRTSLYKLVLPQAGLREARLVLTTDARVFHRELRLRTDAGQGPEQLLAMSSWEHGDPNTSAPSLALALPPTPQRQLVLEVEEGDNQPLALKEARLLLPAFRLRFFHPGKGLTLCYGSSLEAPRYDLALLAASLREAPARELILGQEGASPAGDRSPWLARGFWGVLVLAVLALLGVLARVLRSQPEVPPQA